MKQEQVMQVMNDPLAQKLMNLPIPARLAYTGLDGFPRAILLEWYAVCHGHCNEFAEDESAGCKSQGRPND
jgi:hypothetical protein